MSVVTLGEPLVEFYRREIGKLFKEMGDFVGPYPAGGPAVFVDTRDKLGPLCKFFGVVDNDEFRKLIKNRFEDGGVDISRIRTSDPRATGSSFVTHFKDGNRKLLFH